jgi:hypothetical protein
MNDVFSACKDWFKKNLMSLNFTKTHYVNFKVKNKEIPDMGEVGNTLTSVNTIKFLGLYIQNDIRWNKHIEQTLKKLNTATYMITN